MKLAGAISIGSGLINEDACGYIELNGVVEAAWVLDGVTGLNSRQYLPGGSDARWLVSRVNAHLQELAGTEAPLASILHELVDRLVHDWASAIRGVTLPKDHDMPATCIVLAKRYHHGWEALRLGDSIFMSRRANGELEHHHLPPSELGTLEHTLKQEARKRRAAGQTDIKALLEEFTPQMMASRRSRNTPGNHSILVPDASSLSQPEYVDLGKPAALLLATDGFYRAVDHYGLFTDETLLEAGLQPGGVEAVLRQIRQIEADDAGCEKYLRFKPADDASAVVLKA